MTLARPRALLLALALLCAGALPLAAQQVRIRGDDRSRAATIAREVLARGAYVRIDRDTILPASFRAPADLVVYDAEVRLEGQVAGSVVVIGGDLWLRPGSRVGGPIAVIDGGVYPSAHADFTEVWESDPGTEANTDTVVVEGGDTVLVATADAPPPPRRLSLAPPVPPVTYDRVNGITASAGLGYRLTRGERGSRVAAWASWRQEQENHVGGGVRLDLATGRQNVRVLAEASRATRTNDEWIRGALSNSFAVASFGRDYRDYWDSDLFSLGVARPVGKPLIAGESWLGPHLRVQLSEDRPLEAHRVWSLWNRDEVDRVNPPALEGRIVSAVGGATLDWRGRTSQFTGDLSVEHAFGGLGDAEFDQATVWGRFQGFAVRLHTLEVYFRGTVPFGPGEAPPQREGILGGNATLPTLAIGHFRGSHLAFVESSYLIPFPRRVQLPYVGVPSLELYHATGAAWSGEEMPPWVRNVGAGLRFPLARLLLVVDPSEDGFEPTFLFTFSIPRRGGG